jgi:hypothetical protein
MDQSLALRHFLATLAYRGTNVLREMPSSVATRRPHPAVRTPLEILNHINGVLTYAHSFFVPYDSTRPEIAEWSTEVERFFDVLRRLDDSLSAGPPRGVSELQLLQGPFADAMLHLGQIGILRRMAGSPVEPENYLLAEIEAGVLRTIHHDGADHATEG